AMLDGGHENDHALLHARNVRHYAARRFADLEPDLGDDAPVCVLSTEGVFGEDGRPPLPLYPAGRDAGRRAIPRDAARVRSLSRQGASYLASQVDTRGRFGYGWHPCFDRPIRAYNALRHASTLYAMLEAWEITREASLAAAIDRGLTYLCTELIRWRTLATGEQAAFLVDAGGEVKLG